MFLTKGQSYAIFFNGNTEKVNWDKVFKNGPSKIYLKNLK